MKRFIFLAFFTVSLFGGELADLRDECKKGNKEVCKSLSNAIKNLELACEKGGAQNAIACAGLGYFYEFDKEFTKAVARYEKACELGADRACVYLGLLYQNGQGAAQDRDKANELFRRACEKDVAEGCASLAYSYGKGLGVYPDGKKANELFSKACELGEETACYNLGLSYAMGDGGQKDTAKAAQILGFVILRARA